MKIADIINGKSEQDKVSIDGKFVSVATLKRLLEEGYENIRPETEANTFFCWGKSCTACFKAEQLEA